MSNQDAITQFLAGKGLTAAQIAGVEGNLQTESGLSPTAYNPREGAIGIAQWEGGRRTALDAYAKASGGSETDLSTQLGFLWSELTGSEHSALTALLNTSDPTAAATVFDQQYERSSAASLPARIANAKAIAAGGVVGGSGQVATGSGGASPTSGPTAAPAGWLSSLTTAALRPFGKIALDAGLVVMGLVMVIVAAVILAKGGDSSQQQPAPAPAGAGGDEDQAAAHPRGRATGAAEDAAEVAA